jgi:hypothetical protein
MSLFNAVAQFNRIAPLLMQGMEWTPETFPRFRDCYPDISDRNDPKVIVLTRTGGGNREYYEKENEAIREMAGFVSDKDDDFDSTFAHWSFRPVSENAKAMMEGLIMAIDESKDNLDEEVLMNPMDRFRRRVGDIK